MDARIFSCSERDAWETKQHLDTNARLILAALYHRVSKGAAKRVWSDPGSVTSRTALTRTGVL
jgi:hypothetical protein